VVRLQNSAHELAEIGWRVFVALEGTVLADDRPMADGLTESGVDPARLVTLSIIGFLISDGMDATFDLYRFAWRSDPRFVGIVRAGLQPHMRADLKVSTEKLVKILRQAAAEWHDPIAMKPWLSVSFGSLVQVASLLVVDAKARNVWDRERYYDRWASEATTQVT